MSMILSVIFGTILSFLTVAPNNAHATTGDEIRVAFGVSIPPYVLSDEDRGIEYDIIKEALAFKGHKMKPVYMPFIQVKDAFIEDRADAIATLKKTVGIEGYYSDLVITYHNFAISLASNNLSIKSIDDLASKKIIAFQLATKYMGAKFAEMANSNSKYREKADQKKQAKLLFKNKTDVIIADKNIFRFFNKQIAEEADIDQEVVYHNIFPENDYLVAFKDVKVRQDFNAGLKHLRNTGRYEEIIKSYTE